MNFFERIPMQNIFRLTLFIATVSAIGALFFLRQARASVDEAMLGFGSSLMAYPDSRGETVRHLLLNGARVHFRTETVEAPIDAVLAHYETLCDGRDAFLAERLSALLADDPKTPDDDFRIRSVATTAARGEGRGYVACVDLGDREVSVDALVSRLVRFSHTGALRELGQARYAYAQQVKGSDGRQTFLLTMWTGADFNVYDILPRGGRDAAGVDPIDVPRPPNSQRILSSSESGQSSAAFVYLVNAHSLSALERFYRAQLPAGGWVILERHAGERLEIDQTTLIAAHRGDEMVTVLAHPKPPERTVVTILAVGAP